MRKFLIEYKLRIQQTATVKLTAARIQQPDAVEFHLVVIAKPSQNPPFTLTAADTGELKVVAELVEVQLDETSGP